MSKQTFTGEIRISHYSGGNRPEMNGVTLSVRDAKSGALMVELDLSVADMGRAILGDSGVECLYTLLENGQFAGAKRENKTETVMVPREVYEKNPKAVKKFFAPYEAEGWFVRESDYSNHHNIVDYRNKPDGPQKMKLVFFRTIDRNGKVIVK